eukprot:TRINITY_DN697_c0_g1_i1.p1 TRINITY_DN697_c0_g1~~TRINITY_DN697_c0_g1_i1.p1  ORF type:complete len:388 (+),score=32.86 TRINITY_DN697_c0_g1_i1:105-1268(+)
MTENGTSRIWTLHDDGDGQGSYFYNEALGGFSTWTRHMDLPPGVSPEEANDTQLWLALCERQIREVFKMCSVCAASRETFANPMYICGTCLKHCHMNCSKHCTMVVDSALWETYGPYLKSCLVCLDEATPKEGFVEGGPTEDQMSAQAALNRLKSVFLPYDIRNRLQKIESALSPNGGSSKDMALVAAVLRDHYCPGGMHTAFALGPSYKGGNGIFATRFIPALTRVGIYPGYPDPNSADQCLRGRPSPKYALAEFNAADYYNVPFPELMETITPFLNEPGEGEKSNTAWLQESGELIENGRLSVITVRDIHEGEEVTLSYGPLYPRDYPYAYDAYSFHPADEDNGDVIPDTFVLWYYAARDAEAEQKGWVRYEHGTKKLRWVNNSR